MSSYQKFYPGIHNREKQLLRKLTRNKHHNKRNGEIHATL